MATPTPAKKKDAKAAAPKKAAPPSAGKRPSPPTDEKSLPLKGKKVMTPKAPPVAPATTGGTAPTEPMTPIPAPEANGNEKPLCWIELVKNGNVFVARSNTYSGASKEYKNRVLEDMLTELIMELQEEISE